MAAFDKSDIVEFFLIEAAEHIQNLNNGLLSLEKDQSNSEIIDELFRAAHTLKGSAAMMGLQGISDVAHKAEDMLGQFRAGAVPICKETLNFLFDTTDAVKLMVDGVAAKKPEDLLLVDSIIQSYADTLAKVHGTAPSTRPDIPKSQPARPSVPLTQAAAETQAPTVVSKKDAPAPVRTEKEEENKGQKDELDLAWEKTFGLAEEEAISVEPIEEEAVKAGGDEPIMVEPFEDEPPAQEKAELGGQQPAAEAAAGPGTLRQEIEEAKKTAVPERRGVGRRAADAVEVERQFIRVNIERLDNLMNLVGEMVVNRNRLIKQVELIRGLREELSFSQKRLLHEIKKFEEKYEYTLSFGSPSQQVVQHPEDFFELEFDRYDDFNLLSRKLAEITNDTNEVMTELAEFFDAFELDTARISSITSNLQDEITMARMVEMDKLFQMFQRPVRDLCQSENKQVNLVVTGGETKIDKTIFEIISDPLMHMVRNAVSHGIEPPEERRARGKDPAGSLILSARHEGNNIILEIQDDGRGMDPAVLRKAAVDKGFLGHAEAQALTDTEAINLIFRPGFSTAATVGKVSGRGVGMDVVATQLAKINGRIEIKTEPGIGTRFTIHLPLTLVIAHALIVRFGDQEMAVPMSLVEETTRFSFKEIQRIAGDEMVNLRGTLIRLLKLNEILRAGRFPKKDETFRHPTLILGMAEKRLALMVEDIVGREEIVVKSLGEYLKTLKMFSGATISGEGDVRLILNAAVLFGGETAGAKASVGLVRDILSAPSVQPSAPAAQPVAAAAGQGPPPVSVSRKPRVLVVDDSISIRKYVQRFLDRTGYEVEVAPDGAAALDAMGRSKFDVVISDLEMPVMHGYDLMAEMKKHAALKDIPIIVLTSRAGEKHKQKAMEMGAQDYLVKPFEEQEMLAALKRVLSGATLASRV